MSHNKKSSFGSHLQVSPRSPSLKSPGNSHFFLSPADIKKAQTSEESKMSPRDKKDPQVQSESAEQIQKKSSSIESLMNQFLSAHTLGDVFPPNQRLAVFSDRLNLLDFIKLYAEQPIQHSSANCEACLIYNEAQKDFIAALSRQDVQNIVLYFTSAASKVQRSQGSLEEEKDPDETIILEDQKKGFQLYFQSKQEAILQIKRLSEKSFEESKQLISKLIYNHSSQHSDLNDFTQADQTLLYLQMRVVSLRDWIAFYTDTLGELQCKISIMQPETSLLAACSVLQGPNTKETVIVDRNGTACGIFSRLILLQYIQRYLQGCSSECEHFSVS